MKTAVTLPHAVHRAAIDRLRAYYELSKPRIDFLVIVVAAGSFYIAAPHSFELLRLLGAVAGIGLLGAGIFALNHYYERDSDRLMRRTEERPLPSGRLTPLEAFAFGALLTLGSIVFLALVYGWLAGLLAAATFISYVYIYTPLKRVTVLHTALGALPGAAPPLLGWAAARGHLDVGAWLLFAIMFFWQFPHFLAIEMMYRDDYAKAGVRVLPVVDPTLRTTTIQIIAAILLLLTSSILAGPARLFGPLYVAGASVSGAAFLACGIVLAAKRDRASARLVLLGSVLYLPLLFGFMVLDVVA